jgi:hypothetical protein
VASKETDHYNVSVMVVVVVLMMIMMMVILLLVTVLFCDWIFYKLNTYCFIFHFMVLKVILQSSDNLADRI